MTSKEALEELCSRCYVESEKCSCHARYQGGECSTSCAYKDQIKQDLERLGQLTNLIDILKEHLDLCVYKTPNNKFFLANTDYDIVQLPQKYYELCKELSFDYDES